VLVFQTAPAANEVAYTGAINGHLWLSSDAIDTDFMVRISDVYPNGEAHLLQDSAVRMRWRNGGTTPQYLKAGEVYPTSISLWNTSYVLAPGHSLRFAISSSNYPRFSLNANNGLLLADPAYPGVNITATNTVHHSAEFASYIEMPVVAKAQMPKIHNIRSEWEAAYPQISYEDVLARGPALLAKLQINYPGNLAPASSGAAAGAGKPLHA